MTATIPLRETRELLLQRARDAMTLAEAETLPARARIHLAAAERWIELADRKLKGDIRRAGAAQGKMIQPSKQAQIYFQPEAPA
jgi:hypothetical protein